MDDSTNTLTTTIDCNGKPYTVSTERQDGESLDDFAARHDARVAQAQEACDAGGQPDG